LARREPRRLGPRLLKDLAGIRTARGLAERVTLVDETGRVLPGPLAVIAFDTPDTGVASPVNRTSPGFVGRGKTKGGAREFVVPNVALSSLTNVTVEVFS
jgi:hypothetical protein